MKKIYVLLLLFSVFGCQKKENNKQDSLVPTVLLDENAIQFDSLLVEPYGSRILREFYKSIGYRTVWQSQKNREEVLKHLNNAEEEGLKPADYKIKKLEGYEKKRRILNKKELAEYDILLTRNFQKYIAHLNSGKLNPRNLYKDWDLIDKKIDINKTIISLLKSNSLTDDINKIKPNNIAYKKLKKALKTINSYPKDNFTKIEINTKIIPKDSNTTLINIKKRLIYWKDLKTTSNLTAIYDSKTVEAIKKFQTRHGLVADGIIGKGTVAALNFSKEQRREQIIVNLERWKWFPKEMGDEYLLINIPAYKLTLIKDKKIIKRHKVIVGSLERKTPILSSKLSAVVFNPTWTVPPTILKEDVIPAIDKSRDYLIEKNIKIYTKKGDSVSAEDWDIEKAENYRYVQSPGTFNSLGMVKILFPNRFSVYLHDTNHRSYFSKSNRSLSSGCVRVENPLELTEDLLGDSSNWNLEKITSTLKKEKTKYVKINNNINVHILYWTAWSEGNNLIFREDIYNLDSDLYKKLRS